LPFARDIFDEAHIAGPQVSAGSVAGFHIDLTEDGDRELARAGLCSCTPRLGASPQTWASAFAIVRDPSM
jgi:hypothetical protein